MEVLDKEPQKLLSIKGIAQRKLKAIIASYEETKALSDLMIYLAPFGVSMKKAAMIKEEFGDNSLKIVKLDPFQLCKIKGFGFMTVDSDCPQNQGKPKASYAILRRNQLCAG